MYIHNLAQVNMVCSNCIAIASSCITYNDPNKKEPKTMVITIALDPEKTEEYDQIEAQVYIPADNNYHSLEHYRLLNNLSNEPFAFVRFEGLEIHISANDHIYATAKSFSASDVSSLEDVL